MLAEVHDRLVDSGDTVGTAESLTGGLVAARLTSLPGSSGYFRGGVVVYATDLKREVLEVPATLIAAHGVVSAECAAAMASGVRALAGSTYGLATTGVAGPGEQEGKAPGTVWIACASPRGTTTGRLRLDGDRTAVRQWTVDAAVVLLLDVVRREEPRLR